ncbi:major facilitator transporter [Mycolicibacter heraklionensis]|uniref:Major facilitator transporter n=1 Tax=Mycolicibacter heraklionensis TaxID=512402 RepID=A0ABR5FHN1_9MYCO|nr:MFS transporter [Mycolicibacter heraklionensis]KLO30089.1 major facilitator transporter [Mycolicibacter heraklionensis]
MSTSYRAGAAAGGADLVDGVPRRRIAVAAMVGTTIEFYDFYVYAAAAVTVFPQLFFPKGNPTAALLASLATFGLAFVARPLGSILFGHYGDRLGRKSTLVASLLLMGVATFLIGVLPTYHHIGLLAPVLLAALRFCQGLALGGEWSGAALLATETAKPGRRATAGIWPQLGAPLGYLIATAIFLILFAWLGPVTGGAAPDGAFLTWGWRIPFLLSAVMVAVGLYVRLRLTETPVFAQAIATGAPVNAPIAQLLRRSWRRLIIGTLVMVVPYTLFYTVTTWSLSYGTAKRPPEGFGLGYGYADFLGLQLIAVLFFVCVLPIVGRLADHFGRRPLLLIFTAGIMVYGTTFGAFLKPTASTGAMLAFLIIGMTLMGLAFGPMSAVLPELFPTNVRYTGSGVAYNAASILGAAVAPFITTWLAASHGVAWVGGYLSTAAALSFVALLAMHETRDTELHDVGVADHVGDALHPG